MKKYWYVLYTKNNCELKVSSFLTKKNIPNYCPLNKTMKQYYDRKKIVIEPLFSSYVFVNAAEIDILKIRHLTNDIVNYVYWIGKPVVVKDEEIENIKIFLEEYDEVKIEKKIMHGEFENRTVKGPFMDYEMGSIGVNKIHAYMEIQSLGYIIKSECEVPNIEVIKMDFENTKKNIQEKKHSFSWN